MTYLRFRIYSATHKTRKLKGSQKLSHGSTGYAINLSVDSNKIQKITADILPMIATLLPDCPDTPAKTAVLLNSFTGLGIGEIEEKPAVRYKVLYSFWVQTNRELSSMQIGNEYLPFVFALFGCGDFQHIDPGDGLMDGTEDNAEYPMKVQEQSKMWGREREGRITLNTQWRCRSRVRCEEGRITLNTQWRCRNRVRCEEGRGKGG